MCYVVVHSLTCTGLVSVRGARRQLTAQASYTKIALRSALISPPCSLCVRKEMGDFVSK